ncbi:hypothetical protein BASA50_009874 [Batrachochytrium salamandrivorans]|uniref:SAP domain-containing protein n=1 Tax=Batrachochytrium salamandrivorans TaxID=1357716 RepID=A0ABQ8F056_9FUNG|nr:hypothetical protein BASA60_010243 [Batrachochytrium salamandrivorans]KAH6589650.1 hypothetical protein BASA50_009907 [Batrachochytrium salamandrivorans]KAH6589694.1 hypothetical protein BASA50_009874 [Batrachochytrium salamandrivorans]KAJ1341282.1 hypothetical protein BSLG_004144 [Batrachochytrium salamandrivorans]
MSVTTDPDLNSKAAMQQLENITLHQQQQQQEYQQPPTQTSFEHHLDHSGAEFVPHGSRKQSLPISDTTEVMAMDPYSYPSWPTSARDSCFSDCTTASPQSVTTLRDVGLDFMQVGRERERSDNMCSNVSFGSHTTTLPSYVANTNTCNSTHLRCDGSDGYDQDDYQDNHFPLLNPGFALSAPVGDDMHSAAASALLINAVPNAKQPSQIAAAQQRVIAQRVSLLSDAGDCPDNNNSNNNNSNKSNDDTSDNVDCDSMFSSESTGSSSNSSFGMAYDEASSLADVPEIRTRLQRIGLSHDKAAAIQQMLSAKTGSMSSTAVFGGNIKGAVGSHIGDVSPLDTIMACSFESPASLPDTTTTNHSVNHVASGTPWHNQLQHRSPVDSSFLKYSPPSTISAAPTMLQPSYLQQKAQHKLQQKCLQLQLQEQRLQRHQLPRHRYSADDCNTNMPVRKSYKNLNHCSNDSNDRGILRISCMRRTASASDVPLGFDCPLDLSKPRPRKTSEICSQEIDAFVEWCDSWTDYSSGRRGSSATTATVETAISASSIASTALIYELDEQRRIASLPLPLSFQSGGIPQHYLPTHPLTAITEVTEPSIGRPKHWSDPSQDFHRDGKSLNWHDGSAHFQLLDHRSSSSGSNYHSNTTTNNGKNNSINRRGTSMPCLDTTAASLHFSANSPIDSSLSPSYLSCKKPNNTLAMDQCVTPPVSADSPGFEDLMVDDDPLYGSFGLPNGQRNTWPTSIRNKAKRSAVMAVRRLLSFRSSRVDLRADTSTVAQNARRSVSASSPSLSPSPVYNHPH